MRFHKLKRIVNTKHEFNLIGIYKLYLLRKLFMNAGKSAVYSTESEATIQLVIDKVISRNNLQYI